MARDKWAAAAGKWAADGTRLASYTPKNRIIEDYGTTRGDILLSDGDKISLAYTTDRGRHDHSAGNPLFAADLQVGSQVASLEHVHIFGPALLNTLRPGFSRAAYNYDSATEHEFPAELSFVKSGDPGGIAIGGGAVADAITTAGGNINAGVWNRRNLFTLTDSLQFQKEIHTITAGVLATACRQQRRHRFQAFGSGQPAPRSSACVAVRQRGCRRATPRCG